jgi:hypothetical protein
MQTKSTMEIALERAGVASPPEKIVELRNAKDIARAVRYAKEELLAHLQLGTADTASKKLLVQSLASIVKAMDLAQTNSELAEVIDAFLKTVSELDQSVTDLLSGAEAQIAELAAEINGMQSTGGGTPPTITLSMIDAELARRGKASDEVGAIQERFEDDQATMRTNLATLKQRIQAGDVSSSTKSQKWDLEDKLGALDLTIAAIIEAVRVNDEKVGTLIAYRNAVKLLEQGVPRGIIGEKLFDFKK